MTRYTCPWCGYPATIRSGIKEVPTTKVIECQQIYCKKVTRIIDLAPEGKTWPELVAAELSSEKHS